MTRAKIPADTTCRTNSGGCGREVIIVRELFPDRKPWGTWRVKKTTHQIAIHADELNERPDLQRVRVNVDGSRFSVLRRALEMKCEGARERLEQNAEADHGHTPNAPDTVEMRATST